MIARFVWDLQGNFSLEILCNSILCSQLSEQSSRIWWNSIITQPKSQVVRQKEDWATCVSLLAVSQGKATCGLVLHNWFPDSIGSTYNSIAHGEETPRNLRWSKVAGIHPSTCKNALFSMNVH